MSTHQDSQQDGQNGSAKAPHRPQTASQLEGQIEQEAAEMVRAVVDEGQAEIKEMQAVSREWMTWAQDAYQINVKAWQALLSCRTAQAALSIQGALLQEQLKLLAKNGQRMTASTWMTAFVPKDGHARSA